MAEYIVYTSASIPECIFCDRAKKLLATKNIPYKEYVIGRDLTKAEFHEQYGEDVKTVPQIVIDGVRIGGFDSLNERLR